MSISSYSVMFHYILFMSESNINLSFFRRVHLSTKTLKRPVFANWPLIGYPQTISGFPYTNVLPIHGRFARGQ